MKTKTFMQSGKIACVACVGLFHSAGYAMDKADSSKIAMNDLGSTGTPSQIKKMGHTPSPEKQAEKKAIRAVINSMNEAVTKHNIDGVLGHFNPNALKMDLYVAHYPSQGATEAPKPKFPKTASLVERWQAVLGIMSGSTKLYERIASHISIHVDGSFASAWVTIKTKTVPHDTSRPTKTNKFTELVVLKKIEGQWKIMMTSNNRHDS